MSRLCPGDTRSFVILIAERNLPGGTAVGRFEIYPGAACSRSATGQGACEDWLCCPMRPRARRRTTAGYQYVAALPTGPGAESRRGAPSPRPRSKHVAVRSLPRTSLLRSREHNLVQHRPDIPARQTERSGTVWEYGGGGGEIRTRGPRVRRTPIFKTGALNHSATPP